MAEEHGCETPEGRRLCANSCGFFGSPATQNMCSKCYRDLGLEKPVDPSPFSLPALITAAHTHPIVPQACYPEKSKVPAADPPPQAATGRCAACGKKVRMAGFRCRCGTTFCGAHRYPETHGCGFDFKSAGREAIARANPVIKADKVEKI